jgi:hypothetical protein
MTSGRGCFFLGGCQDIPSRGTQQWMGAAPTALAIIIGADTLPHV